MELVIADMLIGHKIQLYVSRIKEKIMGQEQEQCLNYLNSTEVSL